MSKHRVEIRRPLTPGLHGFPIYVDGHCEDFRYTLRGARRTAKRLAKRLAAEWTPGEIVEVFE